jgi:hypothetical protein
MTLMTHRTRGTIDQWHPSRASNRPTVLVRYRRCLGPRPGRRPPVTVTNLNSAWQAPVFASVTVTPTVTVTVTPLAGTIRRTRNPSLTRTYPIATGRPVPSGSKYRAIIKMLSSALAPRVWPNHVSTSFNRYALESIRCLKNRLVKKLHPPWVPLCRMVMTIHFTHKIKFLSGE